MTEPEQARAYAEADFEEPNSRFLALFEQCFPGFEGEGYILDVGCGPGDITLRFAERYPGAVVHGVDGAAAMLDLARLEAGRRPALQGHVDFLQATLPDLHLPQARYAAIISNSLLHHLHQPEGLWQCVRQYARPGAPILVMDLFRPNTPDEARELVDHYAASEPEVLRKDFFNSLLAAFEPQEIRRQLQEAGLTQLTVEPCSDRHVLVHGHA
ncbi:class I SAM-dependent methyltransferase [Ectothiorhodospiraceae bacterium WFHF3C12]|nr:class I SAM-dependent methyltransferase [Ectothiorhodospiraceae bacterium WFHF3C12]